MVDAAARDRWAPGPEIPRVHPGLFLSMLNEPERGSRDRGQARSAGCLPAASGDQEREARPLLEFKAAQRRGHSGADACPTSPRV